MTSQRRLRRSLQGRSMDEKTADLQKLAELREYGALTEEEFAQQKQQVLDS